MTWSWILLALAGMAFMYAAGRFDWAQTGRRRVWREARAHFDAETRALAKQLDNDERELAYRREVEHAQVHDPRRWGNGAGYRSDRYQDSPARSGGGYPSKETDDQAKVG